MLPIRYYTRPERKQLRKEYRRAVALWALVFVVFMLTWAATP